MMLSRTHWVFLSGILLAGSYLRFHTLDRQSLWDDEMSTISTINTPIPELITRFSTYEVHPPLYFLQLRAWMKFVGNSLAALRANSAFWGAMGLVILFVLARGYLGPSGGLAATALMAFSPYHLAYSQELRPYAFGIAEGLLALFLLEKCLEPIPKIPSSPLVGEGEGGGLGSTADTPIPTFPHRGGRGFMEWVLLGMVWTALLFTHYWGSFVVLAQFSYSWIQSPQEETRRKALVTFLVSSMLFVFWLPILWNQLHIIGALSFWVPPPSPVNLAQAFIAFTGIYFHHASLAFTAPVPMYVNFILGSFYLLIFRMGISRGPRAAGIWLGVGMTVPYLLSYLQPGLFVSYRYPSLMFPAFVILVASGVEKLPMRSLRAGALTAMLLAGLVSCFSYATTWQKANPKAVVTYVHTLNQPETVVIRPFYFAKLFDFYDHGSMHVVDQHLLDSTEKRAALKGKKVVFIAFDVPDDPVRDALLSEFRVVSSRYFPGFAHLGITVYELIDKRQ